MVSVPSASNMILWLLVQQSYARSWNDAAPVNGFHLVDPSGRDYLDNKEQLLLDKPFSQADIPEPIVHAPTTNQPSPSPSSSPTMMPSASPSLPPSNVPTMAPTMDPFPPVPTALSNSSIVDPSYFNYNDESGFGPKDWGSVQNPSDFYWAEFDKNGFGTWNGYLRTRKPSINVCATGAQQSPIDLRSSGVECAETHEVRDLPGHYRITSSEVKKNILSNKLQLVYPRRSCNDYKVCKNPSPPTADFPNGWFMLSDLLSIDIKIPAEHQIEGQKFSAEMQMLHLHPLRRRIAVWSVLIQAETAPESYNYYFDEALNIFQSEYDRNQGLCLQTLGNASTNTSFSPGESFLSQTLNEINGTQVFPPQGQFKPDSVWNPYHAMLIPTIHFYRYDGSLTEPPCAEFVAWFVADKPMIISEQQLNRMKRIMFTNVDSNCRMTSVHHGRSVARPVQPSNGRDVSHCTRDDFGPDK